MFGIGLPELFIIVVIAIIVIGPDKLPDLARAVGKGIGEFRRATDEIKSSFDADDDLREIKTQLNTAKDEMTSMVREQTKDLDVDNLTKSLEDGTLFNNKSDEVQKADEAAATGETDAAETEPGVDYNVDAPAKKDTLPTTEA